MKIVYLRHRFLDEAGDLTFYKKGKMPAIDVEGVSKCFILGMVMFNEPLEPLRKKVVELQSHIASDPYFDVPSVRKKKDNQGYFFHAKDDLPEIRKLFYDFIVSIDCSFEAFVGRKCHDLFERKHERKENNFYADLLSHLIKDKLYGEEKLILNIAQRGTTTRNDTLQAGLQIAKKLHAEIKLLQNFLPAAAGDESLDEIPTSVVFNVQDHLTEPLLNIADYFCWAVQRVFEKGEIRYYNYLKNKICSVVDLYDWDNSISGKNCYNCSNPLTAGLKIE